MAITQGPQAEGGAMNEREKLVKQQYEAKGYIVLRNGWPDFIAYRDSPHGPTDVKGLEVKRNRDDVPTPQQQLVHEVLRNIGLEVKVEYYEDKIKTQAKVKGSGHAGGRHGKGRLFLRGFIWWIQYYVRGQQVRESSHSHKKAVAEMLLKRRCRESQERCDGAAR